VNIEFPPTADLRFGCALVVTPEVFSWVVAYMRHRSMIEDITKTPLRKGAGLAIGVLRPSLADYFQPANQSRSA